MDKSNVKKEQNDKQLDVPNLLTPKHKLDLGISDDNIYNTFLQSWYNGTDTSIATDDSKVKTILESFITPTKLLQYNDHVLNSPRTDKSTEDNAASLFKTSNENNEDFITSQKMSSERAGLNEAKHIFLRQESPLLKQDKNFLGPDDKSFDGNRLNKFTFNSFKGSSRSNSVSKFSINSGYYSVGTSPRIVKSFSTESIPGSNPPSKGMVSNDLLFETHFQDTINTKPRRRFSSMSYPVSSNLIESTFDSNNMAPKNKNSIHKQFKKFNWREVPSNTRQRSSLATNNERTNSANSISTILTTPLITSDHLQNCRADSRELSDSHSNGNAIDDDLPIFSGEGYSDNIISADTLNKRSWNPRSSFSSVDILKQNSFDDGILTNPGTNALEIGRQNGITNINSSNSFSKKTNAADLTKRGDDSSYTNYKDDNGYNDNVQHSPFKSTFSIPPPLLLKAKPTSISFSRKKEASFNELGPIIKKPRYDIQLVIPYTNDNFDQSVGLCNVIENAKKYSSSHNINWKLTLTYVKVTQEEFLIKDICKTLNMKRKDAISLIESCEVSSPHSKKKRFEDRFLFLQNLTIDPATTSKVKLLQLDRSNFINNEKSSSISTIGSERTLDIHFQQDRNNSTLSTTTAVSNVKDTELDKGDGTREIIKELTIPYLPFCEGRSYAPKSLILFLFNYNHFNENNSLKDYLNTMQKLFTEKEDVFLNLWKHALLEIDNDSGIFNEYNIKHFSSGPIIGKFTFYKPSHDLRIVIDEYFTTYTKEKFDELCLNDCFNDDLNYPKLNNRRSSFLETHGILQNIFKGEIHDLIV